MATVLDYDIKFLPGVGEKRAGVLARELGIRTFGDLLYYFPFRYVDRTKLFRIGDIGPDAPAYIQVRARVTGMAYEGEGANGGCASSFRTVRAQPIWCGSAVRSG